MIKKLALLSISALLLSGCTLGNSLKTSDAAQDSLPEAVMTSPTPTTVPDPELQEMPSTSTTTDETSLETDINNTKILDEDFSDLE
ncbi:MAG: hypothetical protein ABII21_02605 [bacterium]